MECNVDSVFFFGGITLAWVLLASTFKLKHVPTSPKDSSKYSSDILPIQQKLIIDPILSKSALSLNTTGHLVLGVAGGSGSGKTTLASAILAALGPENIAFISHDSYYRDLSHLTMEKRADNNFDHPDSLETSLLVHHVKQLKKNLPVRVPVYDYGTHSRTQSFIEVLPRPIILVEGILIFSDPELCTEMDIKIFVDTDDDLRFIRRLQRDIAERDRTVDSVVQQYLKTVRPMHTQFVAPSRLKADMIVPVGVNSVALDMLVSRLQRVLATE